MIGRKKFEGDRIRIRELKGKRRRQNTGERERSCMRSSAATEEGKITNCREREPRNYGAEEGRREVGRKEKNDSKVEKRKCENMEEAGECDRILERGRNFKRGIKMPKKG